MESVIWNNEIFKIALEASPSVQLIVNNQGIIKYQ